MWCGTLAIHFMGKCSLVRPWGSPEIVTIPQYRFNEIKQRTHTKTLSKKVSNVHCGWAVRFTRWPYHCVPLVCLPNLPGGGSAVEWHNQTKQNNTNLSLLSLWFGYCNSLVQQATEEIMISERESEEDENKTRRIPSLIVLIHPTINCQLSSTRKNVIVTGS